MSGNTGNARPYHPLPGMPDEMMAADGSLRPLWQGLAQILTTEPVASLKARRARAEQYLRDSGVFYRQYRVDGSDEWPWPLSAVPVLMDEVEWQQLAPGLLQRAELLERLMADLYGANAMVAAGHLPAELVAMNPEWLRPMVGVQPRSGHFLHFLSFEIGRGPQGAWWVLGDRAQAPSGAGYALENRVATSLAFSDLYSAGTTHRLAGFFRDFRAALMAQGACGEEGRAVILSPGPMNEAYFEHAYIARYLGMTLVEGEDLTVADGLLQIRTVAGPRPVDVLWRRLDGNYADPLELNPASRIGTPGLVSALRSGGLTMVNQLGSGVLEARAMMAFLPQLCQELLGQPLILPNIETLWLGDAAAQAALRAAPGNRLVSAALARGLPLDPQEPGWQASSLVPAALAARLAMDGPQLVAQELVPLSSTPTLRHGKLVARPMTIRVYLARGPNGWQLMPGGFARIGASPDPHAMAMQQGGSTADVWVIGAGRVPPVSLLPPVAPSHHRLAQSALPARAADNLYWLGRYVERSEATMRLLRGLQSRRAEMGVAAQPLVTASRSLLQFYDVSPELAIPPGLLATLADAMASAGRVRDRFSPDAWSALADINKTAQLMAQHVAPGDAAARALSTLLRELAAISGLVHENMYRALGWRFLTLGRLQERAMGMSALLAVLADERQPEGALDLAVELGDAVLTHRRRYAGAPSRASVIDLLGLDPDNPRALRAQIDGLHAQISLLPLAHIGASPSPLLASVMRLQVDLATETPERLSTHALWSLRSRLAELSELLTKGSFS